MLLGDDEPEAVANAQDAVETIVLALIADRKDIPAPSEAAGRRLVSATLLGCLKLTVYKAMREKGWRKADLARALALDPRQIDRLLDLRHGSTVSQLDRALEVCGVRAEVATRGLEAA